MNKNPRALVVDDSLTVRMDLQEGLTAAGFDAIVTSSVAEGRAELLRTSFDVVILDVRLGDGDGVDLLYEIRSAAGPLASTPVMMLSSEADVRDRLRGLKTGADEYAGKPYLLAHVCAKARELAARRRGAAAPVADDRTRILAIDDSLSFRRAICEALQAAGYETIEAETGEDGLQLAATMSPALVIVDGQLPGIDGPTVIRRLRLDAAHRHTPCIMITASDLVGGEIGAFEAGVDVHIHKSTSPAEIVARVKALLASLPASRPHVRSALGTHKVVLVGEKLEELGASLRSEGFDVATTADPKDAVALFDVDAPACVILAASEAEQCRTMRAALPGTSAVLALTEDTSRLAITCLSNGADEVVSKETPAPLLAARVRAQLRRKQSELEAARERDERITREVLAAETRAAKLLAETRAAHLMELERMNAELAAANTELEAFSYSVSHDLRAPLRAIDGFSRVLQEDYSDKLDEEGKAHIGRILSATSRMSELIEDLLALSRVTRAELARVPVDLSQLAADVGADLAARHRDRQVSLRITEKLEVEADPRLLRAVFENLLGNAWKFTSKRADALIEVGVRDVDGERTYFVRDNGVGFDMSRVEKLFRPFQRLHSPKEFEGTGIGLATVRRIIARHGGRTWAEAPKEGGACMYFTLG